MRDFFLAWRYGRLCPYRTRHYLDEGFRPLDVPDAPPRPPASHRRLRNVLIAFSKLAEEEHVQFAALSSGGGQ
jgi:hypothetical protein